LFANDEVFYITMNVAHANVLIYYTEHMPYVNDDFNFMSMTGSVVSMRSTRTKVSTL
jgi:hypothetical protein